MPSTEALPAFFVSADWGKERKKRSVHVADVAARRIYHEPRPDWTLASILDLARGLSRRGPVLIGLDMVFGVPGGYWRQVLEVEQWQDCSNFLEWLGRLDPQSDFFEPVALAEEWRVEQPFFRVPAGAGGLSSYQDSIEGGLLRPIEKATGGKPMFAVSGIPGTVGSGTKALWLELSPSLTEDRDFSVWPFDGELEALLATREIVLAESYPSLAYAVALDENLPTSQLKIAKTRRAVREPACALLENANWVRERSVDIGDLDPARANEDAFDSHFVAAAALRCLVEKHPLCDPAWVEPTGEGGMLLAGPANPSLPARLFNTVSGQNVEAPKPIGVPFTGRRPAKHQSKRDRKRSRFGQSGAKYSCPIPGCDKVFHGSRGGWDSHVASLRVHPDWHPKVDDPVERKRRFKSEHAEWFR